MQSCPFLHHQAFEHLPEAQLTQRPEQEVRTKGWFRRPITKTSETADVRQPTLIPQSIAQASQGQIIQTDLEEAVEFNTYSQMLPPFWHIHLKRSARGGGMAATALLQPTRSARSIASERELRKKVMMFDSIDKNDSAQIKKDRIGAEREGKREGNALFPAKTIAVYCGRY